MKAIMVMFDTLNRRYLPAYGNSEVLAPNFRRLQQRGVTFDNCYAGSLPCMPARRELHTGRYNFLHRSWGPLEPYDDSLPEILRNHGIYTHLVSDHVHYWEDGGATYHNRYSSWEGVRGQEGDKWKGCVADPVIPPMLGRRNRQDWINRGFLRKLEEFPQTQTFNLGLDFIERNHTADNWFLQIETFDPHEPFYVPGEYDSLYADAYQGPHFDWPNYSRVTESPEAVDHLRKKYMSLVSMCDANLGRVLDAIDKYEMWQDTLIIVNTDHGFLLGEHGWWAKSVQPHYNEIAHIPLFIYHPDFGSSGGSRRNSLVQTVDLVPTLYEYFGVPVPPAVTACSMQPVLRDDTGIRKTALFGMHSGHVNITDGRYVYMRAPQGETRTPAYEFTLMPSHMRSPFGTDELQEAELVPPFSFTKGCPLLRTRARVGAPGGEDTAPAKTMLFDLAGDPHQEELLDDPETETRLASEIVRQMRDHDAPRELFERLGLLPDRP